MLNKNRLILWGILLIASIFRLYQPGILPTWVDELNTINPALKFARHGEWVWFGNTTSFGGIEAHSPFIIYVTALPALFFSNPLALRLFYGLLGLLVIALMYDFMSRYIGQNAAIISALFLAVMPLPVYWSRFVWNPNIAPIFIIIWLFTATGYFNDKRWLQAIHWLSLSFIVQAQTALLVLLPVTIVLTIYGAWSSRHKYQPYLLAHLAILTVVIVTLLPWVYGLYGISQDWFSTTYGFGKIDQGKINLIFPNLEQVWENFSLLTASVGYQKGVLNISSNSAAWWAPDWLHSLLRLQTLIILVGAIVLILQGIRKRKLNTLNFFVSLMLLYPLGFFIVDRPILYFYTMPIT